MNKYETTTGQMKKLKISEYKRKRAAAFAMGTLGVHVPADGFEYVFQQLAYDQGVAQTARIRQEILGGVR